MTFAAAIGAILVVTVPAIRLALQKTLTIHVVVPNGFRGVVTIHETAEGSGPFVRGDSVAYTISESASCIARTLAPFRQWHKLKGSYANGTELPAYGYAGSNPKDILLFEVGGGSSDIRLLVGTKDEYDQYIRDGKKWLRLEKAADGLP